LRERKKRVNVREERREERMRGLRFKVKNKENRKEQQNELLTCDGSGGPGCVRV